MEWQQSPYFIPLIIAGLITFFTATYTFRQRHIPGVPNLLALLAGMTIWIFAYAVELNAVTLSTKLFWAKVQWLGVFYIPVGYISFILKYVGDFQRIKKPRQFTLTLLLIPLLTLLLVWTNEGHQLIWDRTEIIVYQEHTFLQLGYALGYWIFIGFAYLLLTSGTLLLLGKLFSTSTQFKGQITLFIASSLFPWLGNFLYITRINPWPYLDPTPFTFAITILCLTWAWTYYNFLDIVPIARGLVIEKLESGVIVLDGQNRVAEINATAVSLFQIEKMALIGKPLPLDGPQWASLAAALQEDHAAKFELSFDQEHYEGSVTLLENVPGELNGRLITLHNITQRIKSELLLQQAKEAAEAADHAKTHFLTNMSHEIRTPLNAVVGMAEMLRQTPLNTNQNEMIDVVAESSEDLLTLINNILDFARLEAGSLTLKQQTFDLNDCIQSSIDFVSQAANEKHLLLTYQIAEGTPTWLRGDPIRLRQILINLLENGVKFTESGEVELFVNQSHEEASVLLQFVVKDSGIGIADDQIQHIFAPFRQADGSLTRMHGGNGLGLAICQRLVTLMGGDISLTSTLGQGTAVHFTAQFSRATDAHPPTVSLRQHKATLTHKRLLVITKDANERRHISRDARIAGLKVYAAASSQEVSYWIDHSQSFDVVLLDATVWQEEPAITTQLYHKDTSLPLPTILLISSDQDQFDITNTDANSFSGHLFSPVVSAQMYDMLLNVISTGNTTLLNHEQNQTMAERYPLNILIVEDNNTNRHVLKNMLDELGYQADVAINGQIAVQAAAQNNYDVILMDVQMPVMDGIEATRQILAACPTEKRPYIIAITAHALEGDREYYLASGMNEYLSKPIAINQLIEVLYQAINYHDLAATRPKPASISPETIGAEEHASTLAAPIDLAELAQLVGEDTSGFLRAMAPIFLKDTEQILQNLTAAVQHTDGPEIRHAAHTLKGSSASMGMPTLSRFSRELEMMAKEGELAQAWQKLEQIQAEYSRVESALQEMVETAVKP